MVLGEYSGFDESEPTSSSGGKPLVVAEIKKRHNRWALQHASLITHLYISSEW